MTALVLHLPMPPSANRLWRYDRGGRPHRSTQYKAWLQHAGAEILVQGRTAYHGGWGKFRAVPITSPVEVVIWAGRPDKRKRDIDNRIKPLLDCLTKCHVIQDDSLVHKLSIEWAEGVSGVRIEVRPYDAKQPDRRAA